MLLLQLLLLVDIDIGQMANCACVWLPPFPSPPTCVQIENLILNLDHNICISG